MRKSVYILFLALMVSAGCLGIRKNNNSTGKDTIAGTSLDTMVLFDAARNRQIPVAFYASRATGVNEKQKVIILNHGYGQNYGGSYLSYSYLATYLAAEGFFVASIQHELPTDSLMPMTGIPQIVRRPSWERGADNMLFLINELKRTKPDLDLRHITLIGHSAGGDMIALFAQKYTGIADKIITLDNRRMALPRTKHPRVYSLRSNDQPADEGVLPTEKEQQEFAIKIIKLPNTIHNDMDDDATEQQRQEIRNYIISFLRD